MKYLINNKNFKNMIEGSNKKTPIQNTSPLNIEANQSDPPNRIIDTKVS